MKITNNYFVLLVLFVRDQKDHSSRMRCWCQRAVFSITSTMRLAAGRLPAGTKLVLRLAKTATCRCVASPCCCPAESLCFRASSLFVARSTLRVSWTDVVSYSWYHVRYIYDYESSHINWTHIPVLNYLQLLNFHLVYEPNLIISWAPIMSLPKHRDSPKTPPVHCSRIWWRKRNYLKRLAESVFKELPLRLFT